jgi:hypothetical protein
MTNNINKSIYNRKRPSHPDDAQTKSKRFFKRKGRKSARQFLKKELKNETGE